MQLVRPISATKIRKTIILFNIKTNERTNDIYLVYPLMKTAIEHIKPARFGLLADEDGDCQVTSFGLSAFDKDGDCHT
jgi:hypothetical protein